MRTRRDLENHGLLGMLDTAAIEVPQGAFKGFIEDLDEADVRACLRQYAIANNYSFLLTELSKPLVEAKAKVFLPLPPVWRNHFRSLGLTVAPRSSWRFRLTLFDNFIRGIKLARQLLEFSRVHDCLYPGRGKFDAFFHFNESHFGSGIFDPKRKDFYAWYLSYFQVTPGRPCVIELPDTRPINKDHGHIKFVGSFFGGLKENDKRRRFLWCIIKLGFKALFGVLNNRWWLPAMFPEAVKLEYFKLVPDDNIARRYVFSAGSCLMRPLWSYYAERLGAEVICVFYSANFVTFTPVKDVVAQRTAGLEAMNWPVMIVTDEDSKKALVSYKHPEKNISVSPEFIDFTDNGVCVPLVSKKSILVFDVPPYRTYFKATRGFHNAYYTFSQWSSFFDDILVLARKYGYMVMLKSKRSNHRFHEKAFDFRMEAIGNLPEVCVLDAGISPSRAIAAADVIIAMPFTSPAIASKLQGKPTMYYDPGGQLDHCKDLAHGLAMTHSFEEMDTWFSKLGLHSEENLEAK